MCSLISSLRSRGAADISLNGDAMSLDINKIRKRRCLLISAEGGLKIAFVYINLRSKACLACLSLLTLPGTCDRSRADGREKEEEKGNPYLNSEPILKKLAV